MFGKKGFTLVEMLFVVLIAAGILALAVPSYKSMRERARIQAATGMLANLGNAIEAITQDLALQGLNISVGTSSPPFLYSGSSGNIDQGRTLKEWIENASSGRPREQRVLAALVPAGYLKNFNGTGFKFYVGRTGYSSTNATQKYCNPPAGTSGILVACMVSEAASDSSCFNGARYYKGGRIETIRGTGCTNND